MLNLFRRRDLMIRILIAAILGLVCVMMVITLIPGFGVSTSDQESASVLARVGDAQITVDQVDRAIRLISRNNPIPPQLYPIYARVILDQMVVARLLEQEGKRLGVQVTDFEVAGQIRQSPLFYPGGSFIGKERYQDLVEQRFGLTVSEYEQQIKQDLLSEKVRAIITDGIAVTPSEVEWEYKRRNEKIKVDYVIFSQAEEAKALKFSQAELAAWFQANRSRYQVAERRKVKYVFLDPLRLRQEVNISDEDLRQYYQKNIDAYRVPEQVRVRHILFKTVGKSDTEIEHIRQKALDVLHRLKRGAKFDELAKQYSEDTATKDKGGDLGWISRGQTVPEFEQAAFGLPKGSISDLVKTMYGFHVIKVEDKQTAHVQSLDEAKAKILPMLLQQAVDKLSADRASKISDELHRGKSLEDVAREYNLQVFDSRFFAHDEAGIFYGMFPEFNDTAFRLRVGETGGPARAAGGIMFLRLVEIQKPHQGELSEADVALKAVQDYRIEKGLEQASQKAREFAARVRRGADFAEVAKEMGVEVKSSAPFSRTSPLQELGGKALYPAFEMPVGGIGGPVELKTRFGVYRVTEHQPIDPAGLGSERAAIEAQLLDQKRTQAFDLFSDGLKQAMIRAGKLKIYEQNLKRYAKSS